ncbi:TetR/AcrR family transcriptional regulator [Amycolatopsis australiensis]|uniref:DNA-binding transcriptional regulator, AcrR family n=1 Tax=Amycolatopsis australiensis TaxID=546364 RepID=A0A1K1SWS6_9PSEU|nr:TetR family transcriptional regulator [Amycolatopsis australiensis]SFW88747.1 DNA-binding transcriptional regulator, AcrR family [Amycolatopsis australiensis]
MTKADGAERRERKSDKTRRRILDAAADLLNRKGFDGTRVSEIATLAELRVPAVYYYFDSREAILEEVVNIGDRLAHENVVRRLKELPPDASALDRICAAFAAHLEMVLTESAYTAAAMRTMGQLPADMRARQLDRQRASGRMWRDLIQTGVEAGEIDPELDPRAARMFLLGAVNWATEWWNPARGSLEEILATAQRLVRNALAGPLATASPGTAAAPPAALTPVFAPPPL